MSGRGVPIGVAIVGVLAFLAGLGWLVIGGAALVAAGAGMIGMAVGVVLLLIGLAFIIFGLGCLKGWGWVWTLGIIMSILGILVSIYRWFVGDDGLLTAVVAIVINLIIILYLQSAKVKAWFGKR
ncbi:MAG: hypothetical protein A4E32_00152 [Methanomassiliicoccales archaeon PtaU1.Bin124]|nr:MAG: hypothetical protein A4E32_00152 [Methanomassiliicoccales archaeon PtaU1.Bin124]